MPSGERYAYKVKFRREVIGCRIEHTFHRRRRQAALGRLTPTEYDIMAPAKPSWQHNEVSPLPTTVPSLRAFPQTRAPSMWQPRSMIWIGLLVAVAILVALAWHVLGDPTDTTNPPAAPSKKPKVELSPNAQRLPQGWNKPAGQRIEPTPGLKAMLEQARKESPTRFDPSSFGTLPLPSRDCSACLGKGGQNVSSKGVRPLGGGPAGYAAQRSYDKTPGVMRWVKCTTCGGTGRVRSM